MEIILDENGDESLKKIILQGVVDFGTPFVGPWNEKLFTFYANDAESKMVGGVYGHYLEGRHSNVEFFWVDEKYRKQRLGSRLIEATEVYLKKHKCPYISLYTMDYQAREFYEKNGFVLLGTIPNWGLGHAAHFMRKALD